MFATVITTHNNQKVETTHMSINNEQIDKTWYIQTRDS